MALRRERVVERLVHLREQHSLTQEQAAHKVGVTNRQWQRWEAGESMPYPRNLDLIAQRFGITVAEFFDDMPEPAASRVDQLEAEVLELREAQRQLQTDLTDLARSALQQGQEIARLRKAVQDGAAKPKRRAPGGPDSSG